MFLRATMADGSQIISEFTKLGNPQRYATQVMSGGRPFNAWRIVGTTHPASGDECLLRTRTMYNGRDVKAVEVVQPSVGRTEGDMSPERFEVVPMIPKGAYGKWKAPTENTPDGAVAGTEYPIKREPRNLMRYVVLKAATATAPELRYALDEMGPTDGDSDEPADGVFADDNDEDNF